MLLWVASKQLRLVPVGFVFGRGLALVNGTNV